MRARLLELALISVGVVAASTEILSAFTALTFWPVLIVWLALAGFWIYRLRDMPWHLESDWLVQVCLAGIAGLWTLEGITAFASAPNSADAMAYHMARIVYWMQHKSVANFATEYLNQIMLQPLSEYVALHFQILTRGDHFANAVAWLSTGGYILAASLVAGQLGANLRGQAVTAVLAATIPNGVLQASGMKNEALLAFLLLTALYYALTKSYGQLSLAVGLACLSKGTAYLFAGPLVLFFAPRAIPWVVLGVLITNGPFYSRNLDLSGSPLGFDSASADGKYVWRNEPISIRGAFSNLLRHTTEQLGTPNSDWNRWIYWKTIGLHKRLGIDYNDKATTWPYTTYEPPNSTNHEADRNNRRHLVLIAIAGLWLLYRRQTKPLMILAAVALGVVALSAYLKWQPFMGRLWLPLFAIACVPVGMWANRWRALPQLALVLLLFDHVRLAAIQNATRPLKGHTSVFLQSREQTYLNDMVSWKVNDIYRAAIEDTHRSGCRTVAIDITYFQLEYPLQALLLQRDPAYKFLHVGTKNPSRKYEPLWKDLDPCVLVCLACDKWVQKF
jgi:hypothetical protein